MLLYTLVYDPRQLRDLPANDSRYALLDQTPDGALPPPALRQFRQLSPLRPVFQAQASETGALLAVADALARGVYTGRGLPRGPAPRAEWVGVNPVRRGLPPAALAAAGPRGDADRHNVFFWSTCCGAQGHAVSLAMGRRLRHMNAVIGRGVFGPGYAADLPLQVWVWTGREGTWDAAPAAVRPAVGGGCQSGWGRLLSVTNAIEAGAWRQGDSGWAEAGHPGGGGVTPPPFQCTPFGGCTVVRHSLLAESHGFHLLGTPNGTSPRTRTANLHCSRL